MIQLLRTAIMKKYNNLIEKASFSKHCVRLILCNYTERHL